MAQDRPGPTPKSLLAMAVGFKQRDHVDAYLQKVHHKLIHECAHADRLMIRKVRGINDESFLVACVAV